MCLLPARDICPDLVRPHSRRFHPAEERPQVHAHYLVHPFVAPAVDLVIREQVIEQRTYECLANTCRRPEISLAQFAVEINLRVLLCTVNRVALILPLARLRIAPSIDTYQPRALASWNDLSGH